METMVYLDGELDARLRRLMPDHDRDRFVNEVVAEKLAALEKKEQITREMREGYIATAAERDELAKDWEVVDLEGWPEYRPKPRSLGSGASGYTDTSRRTSEERPVPRSWR
jgi:hypothetical protein